MKLKISALILAIMLIITVLCSCNTASDTGSTTTTDTTAEGGKNTSATTSDAAFEADDKEVLKAADAKTKIVFNGTSATVSGSGAEAKGTAVTISAGGTYAVSGTAESGSITVNSTDKNAVKIVLNGLTLTSDSAAPISVLSAEKAVISLEENTENSLTDNRTEATLTADEDDEKGAIYSKDDLSFNGTGSLNIKTVASDAINCRDTLKILNTVLTSDSGDDGIIGKDAVHISGATLNITAADDGIKATNSEDTSLGTINITDCKATITTECDAVQAETALSIDGGTYTLKTGGGSANASTKSDGSFNKDWGSWGKGAKASSETGTDASATSTSLSVDAVTSATTSTATATETETASAKALKAGSAITVKSGEFNIDSSDDSIHSNGTAVIDGGTFKISSGDDGIHADTSLTINDGTINIAKSYEGIESNNITVNGGTGSVTASDDGFNVNGGNDMSAMGGRPGQNTFTQSETDNSDTSGSSTATPMLTLAGGNYYINADGDGLDSNGSVTMTGGTFYVDGPTNSGNGALDYNTEFKMTGGTLAAVGAAGMAQTISDSSSVNCLSVNFESTQSAGTAVAVLDSSGKAVMTLNPAKTYSSVVVASPDFKDGETYTVSYGGTVSAKTSGFVTDSSYTGGTELSSVKISSVLSTIGNASSIQGGGGKGFGNFSGNGEKPDIQSGEIPSAPDGEIPSMPDGEMPSVPDGVTPPQLPGSSDTTGTTAAST